MTTTPIVPESLRLSEASKAIIDDLLALIPKKSLNKAQLKWLCEKQPEENLK